MHWKEFTGAGIRRQIENMLARPYRCTDGLLSRCEAWNRAFELCNQYGLDIDPPPTTATDTIARLRAEKDFEALNELYRLEGLNFEADREARALKRWQGIMSVRARAQAVVR